MPVATIDSNHMVRLHTNPAESAGQNGRADESAVLTMLRVIQGVSHKSTWPNEASRRPFRPVWLAKR
jgi:hypothetical protein